MRDRLDASLKLWLSRGRQNDYLLDRGIGLGEAKNLLKDFGCSLSEGQIEYIRKSLAKQKRRRWMRDGIGLAAIAGLAVFAAFAGIGRFSTESKRKNGKQSVPLAQQNTDLATSQRSALETQLKKAREEKAQLAQQDVNLAGQSSALETQLKEAEEKAQIAQQNADLATSQRSALETELQNAQEEKARLELQNTNLTNQSSALETELKKAEEKAQLEIQNTDLQQNADVTSNETSTSKTQVKKAKVKRQLQHANPANRKRKAEQTQRKKALGKASHTKRRSSDAKTP
jgi:hypothetical protein